MSDIPDKLSAIANQWEGVGEAMSDEIQTMRLAAIHIRAAEARIAELEVEVKRLRQTIIACPAVDIAKERDEMAARNAELTEEITTLQREAGMRKDEIEEYQP